MKVLITGGTGFVGSHAAAAMAADGHQLRFLVRDEARVHAAIGPLGATASDVVVGDVMNASTVERALDGCDAVLHAANVYSTDPRRREEMMHVNRDGTDQLLQLAHRAECNPIVYVSSIVALVPSSTPVLQLDGPVGSSPCPYSASKAVGEQVARGYQECGAPVVITNPGGVFGPHDPGAGEMVHLLRGFLGNRFPFFFFRGGIPIVDVRWLARVHAALFGRATTPRRIHCGGRFVPWNDLFTVLRRLTGRRLPNPIPSPPIAALALGRLANALQGTVSVRMPFSHESAWLTLNSAPTDDTEAEHLAGVPPPPVEATLADAIRWATGQDLLPHAWAGDLVQCTSTADRG